MKFMASPPKKGASVLIAVLIMSAALSVISLVSISRSIESLDTSFFGSKGQEALGLAEGCLQEALRRTRINTSYGIGAGVISLSTSNGSCTIQVTDQGGGTRQAVVSGSVGSAVRQITAQFLLTGTDITILSWNET